MQASDVSDPISKSYNKDLEHVKMDCKKYEKFNYRK